MTLKFNTKLKKVADEFADFDLLKPKAQPDPHFDTRETESMFIIAVHLRGYTRKNTKVERNEDGSRITISGHMPVQDMLMVGGRVVKKEVEMRGFHKSFKVPKGVVFDQVNAKFNEDDSELVVRMPKVTKGLTGTRLEELKAEEIRSEPTQILHVYTNGEILEQETQEDDGEKPKPSRRKFKICTPLIFGSAFVMSLIVLVFQLVESKKQDNPRKKKNQD